MKRKKISVTKDFKEWAGLERLEKWQEYQNFLYWLQIGNKIITPRLHLWKKF